VLDGLTDDTIVLSILVHNRANYLALLLETLRNTRHISNHIIIFDTDIVV
jgi:hypothetical protein